MNTNPDKKPNSCRRFLAAAAIAIAASHVQAEDFYLAQSPIGLASGTNAANAASVSFFNKAANWSSPAKIAARIGPGDTVHLVGTITTALVFQKGGTTPTGVGTGPITLFFEPNAVMTSPAWPNPNNATGAITVPHTAAGGLGYVIIDGGANGLIQNTANGTTLANQQNSIGVAFEGTHNSTVQNLTVADLYMRAGPNGDLNADGIGVKIFNYGEAVPAHDDLVTHCKFHDEFEGVYFLYGAGWTNMEYSFSEAYNCNWGGNAGDGNSSASLAGLKVHDNNFHDFANWDDNSAANSHHHNGFFGWAGIGGTLRTVRYYNNVIGPHFGARATSGVYDSGDIGDIMIYNNVFIEDGASDATDDGFIYLLPNLGTTGSGYKIYNNTFLGNGVGTAIDFSGGLGASVTTFEAKNNIASGLGTFIAVYQNARSTLVSDNNTLYNLTSRMLSTSPNTSARFDTLKQWQALGYDLHSSTVNPNLDASYVPQAPSGAIQAALNLSTYFRVDIDGTARPSASAWDIGAAEHVTDGPPVISILPVITSANTASVVNASAFNYVITAINSPVLFGATGLPAGVSIDPNSGIISGVPTILGTFPITLEAINSAGTGFASLNLTVIPAIPVINGPYTGTTPQGSPFTYSITAQNSPTRFGATRLSAGLSINVVTGLISGTPTDAGTFSIALTAANAAGTGTATLLLNVSALPVNPGLPGSVGWTSPLADSPAPASLGQVSPAPISAGSSTNSVPAARLVNLSARATAGTGSNTLITGFVTVGGPMKVLVRGIGPELATFHLSDFLSNPQLGLYEGTSEIKMNSGWAGDPALAAASTQVHTFALVKDSPDAALISTLAPGTYTAQIGSANNTSGLALAEIYDDDINPAVSVSRLVNLSTRANVGTGSNILIVGFTIAGSGSETILIRAIGPSLGGFGVKGVLANPMLTILDSNQKVVSTNSVWGGTKILVDVFAQVGAFPLAANSNDSALVLTLPAGSYTAQIAGADGTAGIALAEIYEVE